MIRLDHDFAELFPPQTAFVPCSSTKEAARIYDEEWRSESITGVATACLGAMPAICHRNVATDAALGFFRLAGLEPPSRLITYATEDESVALARAFAEDGIRLATVYPHIEPIRKLNAALVPPELYNWLNDKSNLEQLCPAAYVPERRVVARDCVPSVRPDDQVYPLVAKGAVAGANGSGEDVRLCKNEKEFAAFLDWFADMPMFKALILEPAIPFTATWCLNYSVLDDQVRWLGAAEQVFETPTNQSGSCIDPALPPPAEAIEVGMEICASARDKGFRGICGLDCCVDPAGGIFFFDLNFRLASSTGFILVSGALEDDNLVGLTVGAELPGPLTEGLKRVEDLARDRRFIPLRLYDGTESQVAGAPSVVTGFVRGPDRDAAEALAKEFSARLSAP